MCFGIEVDGSHGQFGACLSWSGDDVSMRSSMGMLFLMFGVWAAWSEDCMVVCELGSSVEVGFFAVVLLVSLRFLVEWDVGG